MSITKLGRSLIVALSLVFLFACAGQDTAEEEIIVDEPAVELPEEKSEAELMAEANDAMRESRVVYFDLDDDTVSSDGRELLEAHAWFLAQNPELVVTVDGHCDERGTPEYNLALGERRAKSVAQILMLNGVSSSQIQAVSYGEEQPAAEGHDESAWSQNRRSVLSYEG